MRCVDETVTAAGSVSVLLAKAALAKLQCDLPPAPTISHVSAFKHLAPPSVGLSTRPDYRH
ncbi:hypothetical protein BURKHO8Y_120199 [Burkholderia sp. 8Y]|nr:hypothetical protein BURKHO8Y_120199 [Burkholderia sp. 8Y]